MSPQDDSGFLTGLVLLHEIHLFMFHNLTFSILSVFKYSTKPRSQSPCESRLTQLPGKEQVKPESESWSWISSTLTLCDLVNQSQLIVFTWRPSCLVADSALWHLTAVCPNTPRSLLLAGLAGEYYWMSIWPHYKCVAKGNRLREREGEGLGCVLGGENSCIMG